MLKMAAEYQACQGRFCYVNMEEWLATRMYAGAKAICVEAPPRSRLPTVGPSQLCVAARTVSQPNRPSYSPARVSASPARGLMNGDAPTAASCVEEDASTSASEAFVPPLQEMQEEADAAALQEPEPEARGELGGMEAAGVLTDGATSAPATPELPASSCEPRLTHMTRAH